MSAARDELRQAPPAPSTSDLDRLIPVRNGRFHFVRSNIRSNMQSVRSTTEFMMEALRRHDEGAKQPAS